jgi:hypothetical protein
MSLQWVAFRHSGIVEILCRIAAHAAAEDAVGDGRSQPVGDDFKGSSLKVETGGELVPGL